MARYNRVRCECGNMSDSKGCDRYGNMTFNRECSTCRRMPTRVVKKKCCETCGFITEHQCQLDIDHIDGNHKNNDLENLQTLCANCHRLKTIKNGDHATRSIQTTKYRSLFE